MAFKQTIFTFIAVAHFFIFGGCDVKTNSGKLDKEDIIASEAIQKDSEYKLVFFGYAGCYHYCDPRLRYIDPIYEALKKEIDIKMLFIDISDTTTIEAAEAFVKDVNPDFEAIDPDNETIKNLQKAFQDVYIRKLPDGEYEHSGFLYLLKRIDNEYYLLKVYPEFREIDQVVADIKRLTSS